MYLLKAGWKGTFEWDNNGIRFSPLNWPKNDNNEDYCWYALSSTNGNDGIWTLSNATGVNVEEPCFSFGLTHNTYGKNVRTSNQSRGIY